MLSTAKQKITGCFNIVSGTIIFINIVFNFCHTTHVGIVFVAISGSYPEPEIPRALLRILAVPKGRISEDMG